MGIAFAAGAYDVDDALTIAMPLPAARTDRIAFAGKAASAAAITTWHSFRELHAEYHDRVADRAHLDASEFHRICDVFTQIAAAYAVVANVGRNASERFLDHALACFDRIPAIGRLLGDGLISPHAFGRAVLETANIVDDDLLAAVDAEAAARRRSLSRVRARKGESASRNVSPVEHLRDFVAVVIDHLHRDAFIRRGPSPMRPARRRRG